MSFAEIEKTIADYGKRAKEGTLGIEDMQGGTFTISNGGVFGSLLSTPIINPPQSAVLGMHRIEERPVVKDGQIVARPMMYLALSYDHRHHRRPRGGDLPRSRQGSDRGPDAAFDRSLTCTPAKAGAQGGAPAPLSFSLDWTPAFAGDTRCEWLITISTSW